MKKVFHKMYLGLLLCSIGQVYSTETRPSPEQPNFLIIMVDDFSNWEEYIGYTDPADGQA